MIVSPFESVSDKGSHSPIPNIHEKPVRFLGKTINGSSDRKSVDELSEKLSIGLRTIDKSNHKGTAKLWICQHLFVQRIRWPLMIYEIHFSKVAFNWSLQFA